MALCTFATQHPISRSSGSYTGGPFKIVHHTTEGGSAAGAFAAFAAHRSDPHFTVDKTTVFQHIDTGAAARALRHKLPNGIQTNRESAIQIEVVGFAGTTKSAQTLRNVARRYRWLEATHHVPRVWPAGPPKPPRNGGDPGGHVRNAATWDGHGGHFGHSHVPDNVHWDPAYTAVEAAYLLAAEFDESGHLTNPAHPAVQALANRPLSLDEPEPQVMLDHDDVGEPD